MINSPPAKMRIAIVETTHWHLPLYLAAFERPDIEVVGVTDSAGQTGASIAARFRCLVHASPDELIEASRPDVAFVFGRHIDMPSLAGKFISRGIPIAIEKPCGMTASAVADIAQAAERAGLYVAVPFILRMTDAVGIMTAECRRSGPVDHMSVRFIAGPPSRYEDAGVPWMLDPALSGGGPLINLGGHLVDLFCHLADDEVTSVSAYVSSRIFGRGIEDFVSLRLVTGGGRIATIETGYTFPSDSDVQREFNLSARTPGAYMMSTEDGMFVRTIFEGQRESRIVPVRYETDLYYREFATRVIDDIRLRRKPVAGLRDAERAIGIIEAAYLSGRAGGAPVAVVARS